MKTNEKDEKEINPYELDKFSKVPKWLIVFLIKYWAAAAAVFFIIIGGLDVGLDLTQEVTDPMEVFGVYTRIIVLIGLFLTLFMNYPVRLVVSHMNNRRCNTYKYYIINLKGIKSLLVSLVYYMTLSFILFFVTVLLGKFGLVLDLFGKSGGVGIEPFTYGLSYLVVDSIFLLIKNLIVYIRKRVVYNRLIMEA